mgnify:CR=1 FL=1
MQAKGGFYYGETVVDQTLSGGGRIGLLIIMYLTFMNEGAPVIKSQESNEGLVEKVKGLESKIKELKWHKRIAYLMALVGGLGFASEKIDNMANDSAALLVQDKVFRIGEMVDKMDKLDPAAIDENIKKVNDEVWSVSSVLSAADRDIFERMVSAGEDEEWNDHLRDNNIIE